MPKEFISTLRVYYDDTDAGGVVYHSNYLKFMERARSELMLEWQCLADNENGFYIVRRAEVDFITPARLFDKLELVTIIEAWRGATIDFLQIVRQSEIQKKIVCVGKINVAHVDGNFVPRRLPKNLMEKLDNA